MDSREGFLEPVVRFKQLQTRVLNPTARRCLLDVARATDHLGRAAQLSQHRSLIEALDNTLNHQTLAAIVAASVQDRELCSAFSVYFTTLEQAYAWPRERTVSTPKNLHDHKLVVQMLYHEELNTLLPQATLKGSLGPDDCSGAAYSVLAEANLLLKAASDAKHANTPLPAEQQDKVNLLYRTCTQDWFLQGDYRDPESHRQFGRLHEIIHTTGTQRSVQELFQRSATEMMQRLPAMLHNIETMEAQVACIFEQLQIDVSLARRELFEMVIDEVIWGQTFAKYSKPVGWSTIGAGGADCPMFRMLDAVCGKAEDPQGDTLLAELDMRTRHFPPTIRRLIHTVAEAPSVRAYIASGRAGHRLSQAFRVFQQLLYDMYEMHRKKALRIVLALRAGQLYTSSGTQNSASPEWHISNTLRNAMTVRFGRDPAARRITARAIPVYRRCSFDGNVESAILRLDFEAPVALAAGDGISVTVDSKGVGLQTRTYSVTKTYPETGFAVENDEDLHVTKSVEICCRNAGLVSSFICQQDRPFNISVALSPSPHFRIGANKTEQDNTCFIAQNGAAGIFLGWLSRRQRLVGTYTLVIGAPNLPSFIYTEDLLAIMNKFGARLRVVLCLSKPVDQDLRLRMGENCQVFPGRAPGVLENLDQSRGMPTYVCGSSDFALNVAQVLNRPLKYGKARGNGRMRAINTSRMPDLHVHVAAAKPSVAQVQPREIRIISRSELATHNTPGDIWISLGDTVYDISILSTFHPGGEKTLLCRAGLDADSMFDSVHKGSYEVMALLAPMAIGRLADKDKENAEGDEILNILVQAQNDLTNSSRFEQRPTGSAEQLEQAPPSEVVRCSLSQFCKVWKALVERCNASCHSSEAITLEMDGFEKRLAERQESLYKSVFQDQEQCARGLAEIFDAHESAVLDIHAVIDEMKTEAARLPLSVDDWKVLLERGTLKVAAVLGSMIRERNHSGMYFVYAFLLIAGVSSVMLWMADMSRSGYNNNGTN